MNGPYEILHVDPTHPLTAISDFPAYAHLEGRQHLRQCSSFAAEHYTGADRHRSNACFRCRMGCRFPFLADLGQEPATGCAFFRERLVAAVAVVANGRAAEENLWPVFGLGQALGKVASANNAAVTDFAFLGLGPAAHNRLPGQMDDGIEAGERVRREWLFWVPGNCLFVAIVRLGVIAYKARDVRAVGAER